MKVRLALISVLLLMINVAYVDTRRRGKKNHGARFPEEWWGHWYQNGLADVVIHENILHHNEGKEIIIEHHRDYYFVEDKARHCRKCKYVLKRHYNVLEYRETHCMPYFETLRQACASANLRVEYPMSTLIREDSQPVPCPFHEAFNFMYNTYTSGFCEDPPSHVTPCASSSKFYFRFRHCDGLPETKDRELEFQCLATWKEGSNMFLYGGFAGEGVLSKEDMYKCFKYDVGPEISLAMSADASCQGLNSAVDGPMVMMLSRDITSWEDAKCHFPDWLRDVTWRDLSGRRTFTSERSGRMLVESHHHHVDEPAHVASSYRCTQTLLNTEEEFMAVSFSSHGCTSHHQCLHFKRIKDDLIEFYQGNPHAGRTGACYERESSNTGVVLFPASVSNTTCPFPGKLESTIVDNDFQDSSCTTQLYNGCNASHIMEVKRHCRQNQRESISVKMQCMLHWKKDQKHYLIAKRMGTELGVPHPVANCFTFTDDGQRILFDTDPTCNNGMINIIENSIENYYQRDAGPCKEDTRELFAYSVPRDGHASIHCLQRTLSVVTLSLLVVLACDRLAYKMAAR